MIEKECIILVGPQGSGKTTLAKSLEKKFQDIGSFRVSQDEQGNRSHLLKFSNAVKDNVTKIIIDRINHTRQQRSRYIDAAKAFGYITTIIDITKHPEICFDRIVSRKDHPTIDHKDPKTALKALFMYYNNYQKPTLEEADNVNDNTTFNPNLMDLTSILGKEKYLVVGDIHGCFDEFTQLLIEGETHNIVSVGDLIDKGPKIRETLKFFMSNTNSWVCMGNHENKFLRYLIGNKVSTDSLKETIEQTKDFNKYELALFIMSMPKMIKIGTNYIFHAGINPEKDIENQNRDWMLYARKFNPKNRTFTDLPTSNYWHEYIKDSNKNSLFFGHHFHTNVNVAKNVYALDGHCVYGKELRAMKMPEKVVITYTSNKTYKDPTNSNSYLHPNLEPYEDLRSQGLITKSELDDLILYKYSKKCVYDKNWNEFTRKARGIIFDKKTGKVIARPFEKFFNIDEMPETTIENLPKEKYKVYDKLDGSLGIMYWHNYEPRIATTGSFYSEQAIEANKILKEKGYYDKLMSKEYPWSRGLTLLFEIVYPENKIVCDYLGQRDLFLIGAIDTNTGLCYDLHGSSLDNFIEHLGCPRALEYKDATINQIVESKDTISKDKEGWVIKWDNGLMAKVKGTEYLRLHKAIDNVNPINFWENMNNGMIDQVFLNCIPEEFKTDSIKITNKLQSRYNKVRTDILFEVDAILKKIGLGDINKVEYRKKIGLFLRKNDTKYGSAIFPVLLKKGVVVDTLIMRLIKPKGNVL